MRLTKLEKSKSEVELIKIIKATRIYWTATEMHNNHGLSNLEAAEFTLSYHQTSGRSSTYGLTITGNIAGQAKGTSWPSAMIHTPAYNTNAYIRKHIHKSLSPYDEKILKSTGGFVTAEEVGWAKQVLSTYNLATDLLNTKVFDFKLKTQVEVTSSVKISAPTYEEARAECQKLLEEKHLWLKHPSLHKEAYRQNAAVSQWNISITSDTNKVVVPSIYDVVEPKSSKLLEE